MFHRMSHLNIRAAQPIVRAFCALHWLPYQEQGWGAALWSVTRRLKQLPDYELRERPPAIAEARWDAEAAS